MTPDLESPLARTLLAALHGRASEAMLPDGVLRDVEALRLYVSLDVEFDALFGASDGFHAARAVILDRVLVSWADRSGGGTVVELGVGLETQRSRLASLPLRWLGVDGADVLALRRALLAEERHADDIAGDARSLAWLDAVSPAAPACVMAQGLLMYFRPDEVGAFVHDLFTARPDATLAFDTVSPARSARSMAGERTPGGEPVPHMPWGVRPSGVAAFVAAWAPRARVSLVEPFGPVRGPTGAAWRRLAGTAEADALAASVVEVRGPEAP